MPTHTHFIAKFTVGGGPSPLWELERILDLADSSPTRDAWFGTHKRGTNWNGPGICILLAAEVQDAIIAEVIDRTSKAPDEPAIKELYGDRADFVAWWHIRNPIRVKFQSLDKVPGCNWKSRRAANKVFSGQVSFTYWDFGDYSFEDLASAAIVDLLVPPRVAPTNVATLLASPATDSSFEEWPAPEFPVHGVDFSGGEEDRRGSKKIWVATWLPGKNVELRRGRSDNLADKICRGDLPGLIKREPGWWAVDFPFGIAKETARALKLTSWQEWLLWCTREGDATRLRDEARDLTGRAGVAWGQRRQVDKYNQTTWFPLFEQLYRQSIYCAREVLLPLCKEACCVLPWGCLSPDKPAIIVEGFPGATIRDRLMKRRVSYKGCTDAHKTARTAIIKALKSAPFAIPIPDDVTAKAVEDSDGDALDALVLLLGGWIAQRLTGATCLACSSQWPVG